MERRFPAMPVRDRLSMRFTGLRYGASPNRSGSCDRLSETVGRTAREDERRTSAPLRQLTAYSDGRHLPKEKSP